MATLRGDLPEAVNRPGHTAGGARLGRSSVVRLSTLIVLIVGTLAAGYLLNDWLDPLAEVRGWVDRAGSAGPLLLQQRNHFSLVTDYADARSALTLATLALF